MTNQNQPLVEVKENYLIDIDAVINFLKMSDYTNEWKLYNQIFELDAEVLKEYQAPKHRLADLHEIYLITKHRLCICRDGLWDSEQFDKACDLLRSDLLEHQNEENGKPLQLSCLFMVVKESMSQPNELHIVLEGGFGLMGGFGIFSMLDKLRREQ